MIKRSILILTLLIGGQIYGQYNEIDLDYYPHDRFHVALSLGDLIMNRMKVEVGYRIEGPHVITAGIADMFGQITMNGESYPLGGFMASGAHKLYLRSSSKGNFLFMKSSLSFQNAKLSYTELGWYSYVEDGITYYEQGLIDREQQLQRLGVDFELGVEFYRELWYYEMSLGVGYRGIIKDINAPADSREELPWFASYNYSGLVPTINMRVGAYIF